MMFVTTKRFEQEELHTQKECDALREQIWELRRAHRRLLAHLGLDEVTLPQKTVLREKGGPESGDLQ